MTIYYFNLRFAVSNMLVIRFIYLITKFHFIYIIIIPKLKYFTKL